MRIVKSLAVVVLCLLAAAAGAFAQAPHKKFINLLTVQVKPEATLEYEAFAKKVMAAADKINYPHKVVCYQRTSGGAGFTYMFVTYFDTWAEADGILSTQAILEKALGAAEGEKVLRAGRAAIESAMMEVFRLVPDFSTKPKAYDPQPAFLQVNRNEVKPDRVRDWERVIGRFKDAAEKNPAAPTAMRRVSVQGKGATYITSSPYNTGAERDAWPTFMDVLEQAYGKEEARSLDQTRAESIERSDAFILRYRGDLSRAGK
jgi:hypothetical protein